MNDLRDSIREMQAELFEMYQDFHRHPEIGFKEYRTSKIVAEYLTRCGLEVKTGLALTGVTGLLDSGKPGKTLAIRADMDCLAIQDLCGQPYASEYEGFCHACGHDAHVTMLLGAAKYLSSHKDLFVGKIKFIFQPCEEGIASGSEMEKNLAAVGFTGDEISGPSGARFMIQDGALEGVDAILAMHVQPALPLGTVSIAKKNACASTDRFAITYVGKGGHGSRPHEAIDPIPALAELILNLHVLPTREINAVETVVMHICSLETPGSIWSTIPDRATISGGYRAFNLETRKKLTRRVREIAECIAKANNCGCEIVHTVGSSPVINDEKISSMLADSCRDLLGEEHVIYTDEPIMIGEDNGDYFRLVPGAMLWFGVSNKEQLPALHNPRFHVDDEALVLGTAVHVNNALHFLAP